MLHPDTKSAKRASSPGEDAALICQHCMKKSSAAGLLNASYDVNCSLSLDTLDFVDCLHLDRKQRQMPSRNFPAEFLGFILAPEKLVAGLLARGRNNLVLPQLFGRQFLPWTS